MCNENFVALLLRHTSGNGKLAVNFAWPYKEICNGTQHIGEMCCVLTPLTGDMPILSGFVKNLMLKPAISFLKYYTPATVAGFLVISETLLNLYNVSVLN